MTARSSEPTGSSSPDIAGLATPPDPQWSCNLYATGRLDEFVYQVLAPFASERLGSGQPGESLWFLRYRLGGEHLKIRLHHTSAERAEGLRGELQAATEAYFTSLPPVPGPAMPPKISPVGLVPMDLEDRASHMHQDQSLLWTTYKRSSVVLGSGLLLAEDSYVARVISCLGRAAQVVLAWLRPDVTGEVPHSLRQNVLLNLLVSGVSAAFSTVEDRCAYLTYHRDWLVRFPVARASKGRAKVAEIFTIFRHQLAAVPPAALQTLRGLTEPGADVSRDELIKTWQHEVAALGKELRIYRGRPAYTPDPFARDPLFFALLKVFHLVANQLGLNLLDESFAHHLLAAALGDGSAAEETDTVGVGFVLVPLQDPALEALSPPVESEIQRGAFEEGYDWLRIVDASSSNGRDWQRAFRVHGAGLFKSLGQALMLLRRKQLDEGSKSLIRIEEKWRALRRDHLASFHVLGRFFYGTLAYQTYLEGDFDRADNLLDQAISSIATAIELCPFLLPIAPLANDIPLQKARVARRRGRWEEMAHQLRIMREMEEGTRPLCILPDGRSVDYAAVAEFFAKAPEIPPATRAVIDELLDRDLRMVAYRRWVRDLYVPKDVLILSE